MAPIITLFAFLGLWLAMATVEHFIQQRQRKPLARGYYHFEFLLVTGAVISLLYLWATVS